MVKIVDLQVVITTFNMLGHWAMWKGQEMASKPQLFPHPYHLLIATIPALTSVCAISDSAAAYRVVFVVSRYQVSVCKRNFSLSGTSSEHSTFHRCFLELENRTFETKLLNPSNFPR